jgi:hypothetical protein
MMMAAVGTFGAADSSRRVAVIGPRLYRDTGFDRKITPVAYAVAFLRHASAYFARCNKRIQSHVIFFLPHNHLTFDSLAGLLILMLL